MHVLAAVGQDYVVSRRAVIAPARAGEERLAGRSYLSRGMSSCDVHDRRGERQRYSGVTFGDGEKLHC